MSLAKFLAFLSIYSALLAVSTQLNIDCISNSGAVLSSPSSGTWNEDRLVYNQKVNVQPAGVAYARSEAQVQSLVQCAQASGFKAVARGGGHGYEGYAVQTDALVIDISNLTSFQVDTSGQYATFGTGLRLGQLYLRMFLDANSLFPAGTCPWVGSAGHILGGGTGLSSRNYGLACDQLVGLTMVDYQGRLIVANSTHNSDLLWASCGGGGGNLGIVTSYTIKLNSLDNMATVTTMQLNWGGYDNAVEIFDRAQRWVPFANRRVNAQLLIGFGGVSINVQYQGSQAEAQLEIGKTGILGIPGLMRNSVVESSWINASLLWAKDSMQIPSDNIYELNMTNGLPAGVGNAFQAASSYNQQLMSTKGIQIMVNAVKSVELPSGVYAYAEHKFLLGAVSDIPANNTAFYWRDSLFETQWMYSWTGSDQAAAAKSWLSSTMAAMQPYLGQGAYINYPDPILAASSSWPQKYYGNNLARYAAVKSKYDPANYFSNPLTVKPTANVPGATPATVTVSSTPVSPKANVQPTQSTAVGSVSG